MHAYTYTYLSVSRLPLEFIHSEIPIFDVDNVTEWDSGLWCWWSGVPVRQHYKVVMSAHCHKSVPVLI